MSKPPSAAEIRAVLPNDTQSGKPVLRHAYIEEGEPMPAEVEAWSWVRHVANREDGTGLDIWWFARDLRRHDEGG